MKRTVAIVLVLCYIFLANGKVESKVDAVEPIKVQQSRRFLHTAELYIEDSSDG